MTAKHKSPAKKLRNSRRLIRFLQSKLSSLRLPDLSICPQPCVSLEPLMSSKLSFTNLPSISLSPIYKPDSSSKSVQTDSHQQSQSEEYWRSNPLALTPMVLQDDFDEEAYAQNRANARRTLELIDEALKRL